MRVRCIKAGVETTNSARGVPPNPHDGLLENLCRGAPDCASDSVCWIPGAMLDMLAFRATRSPEGQFAEGKGGYLGDGGYVAHVYTTHARMDDEKLAPAAAEPSDGFLSFFTDGEKYGRSFRLANLPKLGEEVRDEVNTAIGAGRCISRAVGNLVLERQVYWLSALLVVIEEILKGDAAEMVKALDKLTVDESKGQPSPSAPSAMATDHKGSSVEQLELLTTEPAVFAHSVNDCYLSRPELLPDEKGRMLPAAPDKYLSRAIFDAVHHAVRSAAIWFYIHWLLHQLFSKTDHYGLRLVLQQELANVCHLEYTLSQSASALTSKPPAASSPSTGAPPPSTSPAVPPPSSRQNPEPSSPPTPTSTTSSASANPPPPPPKPSSTSKP